MAAAEPTHNPPVRVTDGSHVSSLDKYREMYNQSISDPSKFWGDIAKTFHWQEPWTDIRRFNFDRRKGKVSIEWFINGKTNVAYNCLDRHVAAGHGAQPCFYWEGNDEGEHAVYTYQEILEMTCQFANVLKGLGVKKGDPVAIYLPMIVQLPVAMLACARIGAIHSVVFGGFSAEALAGRIMDSKPPVLVTCDGVMRGAKLIPLLAISQEALDACTQQGYNVPHRVIVDRVPDKVDTAKMMVQGRDVMWKDAVGAASKECPCEWMDAEDPLFMLYTSGSTGKPKGVLHTTGGYMVYAATTFKYIFDYREGDVYWCTADCGWITGHTYITYGPMANRAAQVLFEGVPNYPTPSRCWNIVDKYKVTQFYTAPTAIRALWAAGNEHVTKADRSTLRVLGSVGEPINPEAWNWYNEIVGDSRCAIVDTWWQTETGGIQITPLPGCTPTKPGSATLPFFGVEPVVIDTEANELQDECSGFLMLRAPAPGMMRSIYGDHERFEDVYFGRFPGYYMTGDGCRRDADGYYWLTGRVDDVINVSGHRIGTAEVESALVSHEKVAEAAVVGKPHDIKGEGIYAYVTLKAGEEYTKELKTALTMHVRKTIGAFAAPDAIHWAVGLPKTRSGKIMRRILRKIAHGEVDQLGDVSTLADPSVVEALLKELENK